MQLFSSFLLFFLFGVALSLKAPQPSILGDEALIHIKFQQYMKDFGKEYSKEEYALRFENFKQSLKRIEMKNSRSGGATYGITKFSDLSPEEFKEKILMKKPMEINDNKENILEATNIEAVPKSFDWRAKGAVTPVKNQGQCGSCWAFSTVENIESMWIRAGKGTKDNVNLSVQQVVDCDQSDYGCGGGNPPTAYEYIINAGGLESDSVYPYHAVNQQCQFQEKDVVAKISSWKYATSGRDEKKLQENLVNWGPLSICLDAANWQDYTGGVLTAWECAWIVQLDHCVQLVGYNETASNPYWIVRNSWGTDWGIEGYIYLEMWKNTCGMAEEATSSVV